MDFINPKIDFAFKKIFGDEQHKDILISFLNAILPDSHPIIQDLEIINPYLAPKLSGLKDTFLDIRAKVEDNRYVIIEMQVISVPGFARRVLYNITKAYSAQLKPKASYDTLSPVIGLTITDFVMFSKTKGVRSSFVLYDKQHEIPYPNQDVELIFVELPKFKKNLAELQTITDKWLYFIKYANTLDSVPEAMKNEPEIDKAFQIANRINLTQEESDELETREFFVHDMHKLSKQAEDLTKRVEEAEQQAKEAEQQAKEAEQQTKKAEQLTKKAEQLTKKAEQLTKKAEQQALEQVARALLDILDDVTISQKTGLNIDRIATLRQGNIT